jgi:riboflavin kinase/FMN adenylyltransferase
MIWQFREDNTGKLIIPDTFDLPNHPGRAIALGYFDGVHRGHRRLFEALCKVSETDGLVSAVHTFSMTPISKTITGGQVGLLSTLRERCDLIEESGVDETIIFPFTRNISTMRAAHFLDEYVMRLFRAKAVVAGQDYCFGANREGNANTLIEWGARKNIRVILVPPEKHGERVISSSWIRSCITDGDMDMAGQLLGRPVSFSGLVLSGRKLGRKLGFPTANLQTDPDRIMPPYGVYASFLLFEGKLYPSVSNIGIRPTVSEPDSLPLIETMALDANFDLYGKRISVFPIRMIRDEMQFSSVLDLREQVKQDISDSLQFHNREGAHYSNLLTDVVL